MPIQDCKDCYGSGEVPDSYSLKTGKEDICLTCNGKGKIMTHTPGPWTFHQNGDGSYSILGKKLSEREYQWIIGFIQNGELWTAEQIANAKLIAMAPEMLDALISANNYFVDLQNKCALTNSDERAWKLISKAINKATE